MKSWHRNYDNNGYGLMFDCDERKRDLTVNVAFPSPFIFWRDEAATLLKMIGLFEQEQTPSVEIERNWYSYYIFAIHITTLHSLN